jgi:hypothetical protein
MSENRKPSKLLRVIAVILMSLTVLMTLMGGAGTTCVALGAEKYESMVNLVPYKPLYMAFVVVSLATGVWGVPVTISLVRGSRVAHRNALIVLVLGAVVSGLQMSISQAARGASAPANMRFYLTAFTLAVFLLFRLPPIWNRDDFSQSLKGRGKGVAGGAAFIVCGLVSLSTYFWAAPTHLFAWIDVLRAPILVGGWLMLLGGLAYVVAGSYIVPSEELATATSMA